MSTIAYYRSQISQLDDERKALENQILAMNQEEQELIGSRELGCPLIDSDGFPLSDVDVHHVRILRHDRSKLVYDLAQCNQKIEHAMLSMHKMLLDSSGDELTDGEEDNNRDKRQIEKPEQTNTNEYTQSTINKDTHPPIFRVLAVSPDSPALDAGIEEGDLILQFGIYDAHNKVLPFPQYLQTLEDTQVTVNVARGNITRTLQMTPKKWSGRGLLGCQVEPL